MKTILDNAQFSDAVQRLAHLIFAKNPDCSNMAIVGIQQGGVVVAEALYKAIAVLYKEKTPDYGEIDITFYRDDLHNKILHPDSMNLNFDVDGKHIILVDDVLFTGRTIKAALDVLLDYGRPAKVELCVLVDRAEYRQFPIQANYVGLAIETKPQEKIKLARNAEEKVQVICISG